MRVLLAVVTSDSCSIGFAVSMMRLQTAIQSAPNVHATLELVPSLHAAIQLAAAPPAPGTEPFDTVVAVTSHLSFPASFVLRALAAAPAFITGIYPLPWLDWERVRSKARDTTGEDLAFRGNVYNVDAAAARHAGNGYLAVPCAKLGAAVLKREAIDALKDVAVLTDEALCEAWGKDIYADIDHQCSNFGAVEFTGTILFTIAAVVTLIGMFMALIDLMKHKTSPASDASLTPGPNIVYTLTPAPMSTDSPSSDGE